MKIPKRIITIVLCLSMLAVISVPVFASEMNVVVNGTTLIFDQPPIRQDGRILVPFRTLFEAIDASVDWNDDTQAVTAIKDDIAVTLTVGSDILNKNGTGTTMDVPAQIINGRTMIPTRAVAESFGADVAYEPATGTVIINIPTLPKRHD